MIKIERSSLTKGTQLKQNMNTKNNAKPILYGIQGDRGSFNEEAILYYIQREKAKGYEIKYLHTSANVMKALEAGEITIGQMAIHNTLGGIVDESINAIAKYKCQITDKFTIRIAHSLMMRADANYSDVTTIMTHPQVLAQCKRNLAKKHPHLKLMSGKGELVDHGLVAKQLGLGILPKHIATMGSKVLAEINNLKVIETDMQDTNENYTTFVHVISFREVI